MRNNEVLEKKSTGNCTEADGGGGEGGGVVQLLHTKIVHMYTHIAHTIYICTQA